MQPEAAVSSEFPSVISDDTSQTSAYQAALFHLRQGLQALCELSPGKDREKKDAHEEVLVLQRQILQLLHLHFSPERETSGARSFGDVLRQHREEAGLTQAQLAAFSNLSISLVRKLEQGWNMPTRATLLALCSVADLKLVPAEVTTLPSMREDSHRLAPNCYLSPGFDAVSMMTELGQQMNGSGGAIEQTYIYLDPKSALDWIQLANAPSYVAAFRESMPHTAIAKCIRQVLGPSGLDLIALGPGDAKVEVKLVQHILDEIDRPNLRFYLLDASQPLLSRGFRHAVDTFNDDPRIFVCGIQGNFHHLPRYLQLHYTPARSHRRRVYMMLGDTIGNLDNEPQFFQNAFSGAAPGDLLIFDVGYAFSDSMNPVDIYRCDPALSKPVPEGLQRWLGGPIQRYCQGAQSISFSYRLDVHRPLAGSYGLQFIAKVQLPGMTTKEFCMHQIRRYQPESLTRCMQSLGWEQVGLFPFNGSSTRPKGVFVFQKRTPKAPH